MEGRMKRSILVSGLVSGFFVAAAAALAAQDASQSNPYQGVSHPPADDVIVTTSIPAPKPPAARTLAAQPAPQQAYGDPAEVNAAPANPPANSQDEPRPHLRQPLRQLPVC